MPETYLTREGREKLMKDLESLRVMKRQLSLDIGEAREKGDLKENAEYHSAKEKLGEVMSRIAKVQDKLDNAKLIDDLKTPKDTVSIGVKVTLKDEDGDEFAYSLVGDDESDPAQGKISVYSPLAQGLLGKKVGEQATVELPAGVRVFKVVKTEPL
jgi:transcription elongation factor GreA